MKKFWYFLGVFLTNSSVTAWLMFSDFVILLCVDVKLKTWSFIVLHRNAPSWICLLRNLCANWNNLVLIILTQLSLINICLEHCIKEMTHRSGVRLYNKLSQPQELISRVMLTALQSEEESSLQATVYLVELKLFYITVIHTVKWGIKTLCVKSKLLHFELSTEFLNRSQLLLPWCH